MATNWKGGAAYFIKAGERKGGIHYLCLAMTPGKTKDGAVAGCNHVVVQRSFFCSRQGVMDPTLSPSLKPPLNRSMLLSHGRCVQRGNGKPVHVRMMTFKQCNVAPWRSALVDMM